MAGLLDFLTTPAGQGLLSGVASYAMNARRGTPVNNIGRGLVGGLSGYANANDQITQDKRTELQNKLLDLQTQQSQMSLDKANQEKQFYAGLTPLLQSKPATPESYNVGAQQFGTLPQAQTAAAGLDNTASFDPNSPMMPGMTGQNSPLTNIPSYAPIEHQAAQAGGIDKQTLQAYMLQPGSTYASEVLKNMLPKQAKWTVTERYNTTTGMPEKVLMNENDPSQVVPFGGQQARKAPEGMQYDASGNLSEIPGYVTMKSKIAAAGRAPAQPPQPYYQFIGTPNGIVTGNARTGQLQLGNVNGVPVVKSSDSPQLQGTIAESKAAGKVSGTSREQAKIDLPTTIAQGQQSIKLVDDLLKSPGLSTAVGTSSKVDPRNYIPGTDAYDFRIRLDQIKGQQFMQAYQSLKGGGQITEVEGKKATDAISRMNTASSEAEFKKAALEFKSVIEAGVQRAAQKAGQNIQTPSRRSTDAAPQGVDPSLWQHMTPQERALWQK